MKWSAETAEKRIAALGMDDMPLVQHDITRIPVSPDWFANYKELCHKFMTTLTDSAQELVFMNFNQDDFMGILTGHHVPDNISFRFRVPLVLGGKLDIDNLFMCWTFPHSVNMDRFLIEQSGNETIWLPNPAKKIYVPAHIGGGGDGGNATSDRLAQMAAQMAVHRGKE